MSHQRLKLNGRGYEYLAHLVSVAVVPLGNEALIMRIHLARAMGDAVGHAYPSEFDYQYNTDQDLLRAHWRPT